MIHHLQGKLADALPSVAVIDVQGVGYEVLIPLSSFDRLPPVGQEVRLLTHLAVREDAHTLYGFMTPAEATTSPEDKSHKCAAIVVEPTSTARP